MKRVLFLIVSAFFSVTAFCSDVKEQITTAVFNDDEVKIGQQQNQPLILQKASDFNARVYSHRSHYSHYSHRSHYSHYSSR